MISRGFCKPHYYYQNFVSSQNGITFTVAVTIESVLEYKPCMEITLSFQGVNFPCFEVLNERILA